MQQMKTAINVIGDYLPSCPNLIRFPMTTSGADHHLKAPQTNLQLVEKSNSNKAANLKRGRNLEAKLSDVEHVDSINTDSSFLDDDNAYKRGKVRPNA